MKQKSKIKNRLIVAAVMLSCSVFAEKPNVILIMTDDQGYGDLSCHGNPVLKTPHIDRFYEDAVRLTNYHVDPTCAPTRSALMTGRYSDRVGVWHTISGRSLLREREQTMADIFAQNGYETGIFGKWHLGDAFPYRPEDRGFSHVVVHGAGGVGQTPDFWGNDYFNDTYYVNGTWKKMDGFCTDVWFSEAKNFIKRCKQEDKPFFAYIVPNAPHTPLYAPQKYLDLFLKHPYFSDPNLDEFEKKLRGTVVAFFAMIANIDDNFGSLQQMLESEGLADNTVLIFTTDNGTAGGQVVHNAGLRGHKGASYDGGHRVPFIVRWPKGGVIGGRDVDQLTAHIDILPTFIDMLDMDAPEIEFDGTSLREIVLGDKEGLRDRTLVVESQRMYTPKKYWVFSVMNDQWRMMSGDLLYKIKDDPMQVHNVADQYPEVLASMKASYEMFWDSVSVDHDITSAIHIGAAAQNPTILTCHDLNKYAPWNQQEIIDYKTVANGWWTVKIVKAGRYEFSLRRWPAEADKAINDPYVSSFSLGAEKAYFNCGDVSQVIDVPEGAKEVTFSVDLPVYTGHLSAGFITKENKRSSAQYIYALNKDLCEGNTEGWQTREGLGLPPAEWAPDYPEICNDLQMTRAIKTRYRKEFQERWKDLEAEAEAEAAEK